MDTPVRDIILAATGADDLFKMTTLQSLWSGYGRIDRYGLHGSKWRSVIVKHVSPPQQKRHPRGWNTDLSHQRKLHSYQVEMAWYAHWASRCDHQCRVPTCLSLEHHEAEVVMVMEDLDASGFSLRKDFASHQNIQACLRWLAHFHATFMGEKPSGLWPVGTYWHLATRPDELAAMQAGALKRAAKTLDDALNNAPYPTFVHGDAKLANFCFSKSGDSVAAVDFQYVGGGCGMKDVAYFISSCLDEHECERQEDRLLDDYFSYLKTALARHQPQFDGDQVETAWRPFYHIAWADFYRFLQGWSPGHWKIHGYSERIANEVIRQLGSTS